MKKWIALLLTTAFLMLALLGCGGGATEETAAPGDQPAQQQEEKSSGADTLEELMASAVAAREMSFDMVMTMGGDTPGTSSGKMYISGEKVRMEMKADMQQEIAMSMITIIDEKGDAYMYDPEGKMAIKSKASAQDTEAPTDWTEEDIADMQVVGEEKIDGQDCLVVVSEDEGVETKMWLRKDIGMPAKIEVPDQKVVIEYKNYDLGKQDPALFEIPAGTQIVEMPSAP